MRVRVSVRVSLAISLLATAAAAGASWSQSINVDFGDALSAPSPTYAAVGQAGVWNAIPLLPGWQRAPLVNLDGSAGPAEIYMYGSDAMLVTNDPLTGGDAEALLDDMLIGWNDPVDVCIWFDGLINGTYEVYTYALTPADANLECRVRVDESVAPPMQVGGAWSGSHIEGVTYARHTATVTDGGMGLHSGLWAAEIQSGINGIQLRRVLPTGVNDHSESLLGARVISVTPNPARGPQTIVLQFGGSLDATLPSLVQIHDVAGRLVWEQSVTATSGHGAVTWDGRTLAGGPAAAGTYYLRLASAASGAESTYRIVRVR